MGAADRLRAVEIGDGTRDFQYAMVAACGKTHRVGRIAQQLHAGAVRRGDFEQARLFSVRLTGRIRLWGLRDVSILRVLWWDPEHTVCPSDPQSKDKSRAG